MYFTILQLVIELPFYGPFETWKKQQKKKVGKRRGLAIIYDGFNLVGNRIDIRDFRSRNPLQSRRNRRAGGTITLPTTF